MFKAEERDRQRRRTIRGPTVDKNRCRRRQQKKASPNVNRDKKADR